MQHVIFYDGECPLCIRAVRWIVENDKERQFVFASFKGKTAERELSVELRYPAHPDTMVLIENYGELNQKILTRGKAVLRILWILGGFWAILGIFSYLPTFWADFLYRLVAKYRFKLYKGASQFSPNEDILRSRFLP